MESTYSSHQVTIMETWTWNHSEKEDLQTTHPSHLMKEEDGLNEDGSFQINDLIFIVILIFATLTVIVVGLIIIVLVKTYLRSRKREKLRQTNNSGQCYTTTINPSPQLMRPECKEGVTVEIQSSNQQDTTVPEERSTGDITDYQVSIYMEPGCKDMRSNHRQNNTRQESDVTVKNQSHRQTDVRKSDTTMEILDSTDGGMKNQCHTSSCVYSKRLPHRYNISPSKTTDLPDDEIPAATSTPLNRIKLQTTDIASESPCSVPPKKYQLQPPTMRLTNCSAKHQKNQSNFGKTPSLPQRKPLVLMPLKECPLYESHITKENMQSAI